MSVTSLHKIEWKDETMYRRDDKERIPSVWVIRNGKLRISVVFGHVEYPKQWIVHCAALNIDTWPLMATKKDEAQSLALKYVGVKLADLQRDFENLMVEL